MGHYLRGFMAGKPEKMRGKDMLLKQFIYASGHVQLVRVPSIFEHTGLHSSLDFVGQYEWRRLFEGAFFKDVGKPIAFTPSSSTDYDGN